MRTGQCIYGIQTHTCATVKFDEQKLVTGSFDNTVACWEWSTGAKIQHFRSHTGAGGRSRCLWAPLADSKRLTRARVSPVFSVDYNDELDLLVSGSADFSVKVWALSAGACLNTLTGHTEWVTKVRGPAAGGPGPCPALLDPRSCLCLTVMVLLLKVILQRSEVESVLHAPGDYILLSADKYEIKVGGGGAEPLQVQRLELSCPRRSGL